MQIWWGEPCQHRKRSTDQDCSLDTAHPLVDIENMPAAYMQHSLALPRLGYLVRTVTYFASNSAM